MVLGLSLRVSWICMLLFSSGACFPATKGDYKYPYTATWSASSGPGSSNLQSGGSRHPLVSLQHEPSAKSQQPEVAPQQPSFETGNQFPSRVGAPSVAAVSSLNYEPNRFIVSYDSSSDKSASAPEVPSQGAGYISPPVGAGKTPSFSVQPQPVSSTSGEPNVGSYRVTSSPVYEASPVLSFAYPANNAGKMPTSFGFGDGPVPYANEPTSFGFGDGPVPYANEPTSLGFGDGPVPYGYPSGAGSPSWDEQPAGEAYASAYGPSSWVPSRPFPDFSAWDSNAEEPQSTSETSPLPPSSYIIQSRNGYQRAREVLSHTKYSPEYPQPPIVPSYAKGASNFPPMTRSQGGKA
ncbi:paternally-expressed gene 3 protein-like [Xiphias gladius]|uniref:paternally-expressed gene 3 protein-like n=1 Tax=Xiphias gladius TaxID=8245 RepID=UPI001A998492|nr:paternally-expressed gene 3 protein-like [Xiphias gladius]